MLIMLSVKILIKLLELVSNPFVFAYTIIYVQFDLREIGIGPSIQTQHNSTQNLLIWWAILNHARYFLQKSLWVNLKGYLEDSLSRHTQWVQQNNRTWSYFKNKDHQLLSIRIWQHYKMPRYNLYSIMKKH